ncbi:hypothetical protein DH2020_047149 [Rehmannia glutinosa]|uniref:AAA+ ATPase domain-containing protein n=1 Tax=Rehmannia glutinosa TaxID=99300 RepID=A0ABR0U9F1_REHGL
MSVEMHGGGGGVVVGGGVDLSNLHLKKELTQIRKAARVLKDPGTSSSWRSPLASATSLTNNHNVNVQIDGNAIDYSSDLLLQLPLPVEINDSFSNSNLAIDKFNPNEKEKDRTVFLYNWKNQKSESERSRQNDKDDGSSDVDSFTSASTGVGENDSRGDSCLSNRYGSAIFKCKDSNFTPSIRHSIKKKSKRSNHSSASSRHKKEKLQMQMLLSRYKKNAVDGLAGSSLGGDDLLSLVDQSDDTEDYCNSEDLAKTSALSLLLLKLKNNGWAHSSDKKEDDSVSYSTPALSTSFYNRYSIKNPSTVDSWDATTASFNDAVDEVDDHWDFPGRQGCGIPCYWSRRSTPKSRNGSSCSPSFSDTWIKKYQRRHQCSSLGSNKRRLSSKTAAQILVPLLKNSADDRGSSMGSGKSDDELSTNFGELDLEGLSRLDGKRWSSCCRSQEGLELVATSGEVNKEGSPENTRSLSQKYRPTFFEELIGQNIVVKTLTSAVSRGRIAPLYLFHGPRGIGKTSTARIFAAALNCLATEETKPCGVCRECADFISGKSRYIKEVDGSNKKGMEEIKNLFNKISMVYPSALPRYKVVVVDECHVLRSKTWLAFLRLLEKPLPHVVFIFVTTNIDNMPRAILSQCQKHIFNKISDGDIVTRLRKISTDERLDVESNALELIALNADGSLRDAETMLEQLSLFGKRITKSLVNELIGVVSDDKLLDLLELAMSSNATETVIRARELMDSGVDPIILMSQLVTLIVDIIAGTYPSVDAKNNDSFFGGRSLTERELERLKHALTLLSEAEKHLRLSSERSTWFTATLLQLGSLPSPDRKTLSTSSRRQSSNTTEEDHISMHKEATPQKQRNAQFVPEKAAFSNSISKEKPVSLTGAVSLDSKNNQSQFIDGENLTVPHDDCKSGGTTLTCTESKMLIDIWLKCIEKCHSKTLRQLLHSYGKLVLISEMKGGFIAQVAFEESNIKTRAEGFLSSITNSFEIVLRCNVEVKLILLQDSPDKKVMNENLENKSTRSNITGDNSDLDLRQDPPKVSKGSFNVSEDQQTQPSESVALNDSNSEIPLRRIESIIREQRLETAWLQAMDKNTPGSTSHSKPERDQVLPQDGIDHPNELESMKSVDVPLHNWEDEVNHEIKALKINDGMTNQKGQIVKRTDRCPISPSLLHNSSSVSNFSKDNIGYESGSGARGCSGMFCWSNSKLPHGRGKFHIAMVHYLREFGLMNLYDETVISLVLPASSGFWRHIYIELCSILIWPQSLRTLDNQKIYGKLWTERANETEKKKKRLKMSETEGPLTESGTDRKRRRRHTGRHRCDSDPTTMVRGAHAPKGSGGGELLRSVWNNIKEKDKKIRVLKARLERISKILQQKLLNGIQFA